MNRRFIVAFFLSVVVLVGALPTQASAAWGRGHFYVIGIGPAGPQMATLQALETIRKMDVIVAPDQHLKLFAEYVGETPVLFDPWTGFWDYKGKSYRDLNDEEKKKFEVERFRIRDERVAKIKSLLDQGKNVALFDSGNPCLFGPSHWYVEHFDRDDVVIIPGMGCDAAAMAALGRSTIPAHDTRFVIQTAPFFLMEKGMKDSQVLRDIAKYPATWIQYMALGKLGKTEKLFAAFNEVYPPDMPCAVVFWAGHPGLERVVRGTLADMPQKLADEKETFMGLLLIGRFLEGKPYEAAMKKNR